MRIVVTMSNGKVYEIAHKDFNQFHNPESGEYDAIPSFFFGWEHLPNGQVSKEATSLFGMDVRRVNRT